MDIYITQCALEGLEVYITQSLLITMMNLISIIHDHSLAKKHVIISIQNVL